MPRPTDILPGMLEMLILKAVSLRSLHGYGILLRIGQMSKGALDIPQGSIYPALYRLEKRGLIEATWGDSENNRRAKYYTLTASGRKRLKQETTSWLTLTSAVASVLDASPEEI